MKIRLIEDDHIQAEVICGDLDREFKTEVALIRTENEFRNCLSVLEKDPPDVFIIDVMLRWEDPKPNFEMPPEEVREGGFYRAGLRCAKLLSGNRQMANIPVILYSVLEKEDLEHELGTLPPNITFLTKESDLKPLIREVRSVVCQKENH